MSLIPQMYLPPTGGPLYWKNETSGRLADAMRAYHEHGLKRRQASAEALELVRDYLEYYIHAPCWNLDGGAFRTEIDDLRSRSKTISSHEEITKWLIDALDLGIDPL